MRLPSFIARPLFNLLYRIDRRASPIPPIRRVVQPFSPEEQTAFDKLLDSALSAGPNSPIDYRLPYPRLDFLNYICDWRGYVAHGSILPDLTLLQPLRYGRDDNEFGNRQQIFCSPDAIWAMWFAILDKKNVRVTENGCVRVGSRPSRLKFYHFDLPAECKDNPPFVNGMMYIANAADFPARRAYPMLAWFDAEIEEWGSAKPLAPLAKLPVKPSDFPYLDKVQFRL